MIAVLLRPWIIRGTEAPHPGIHQHYNYEVKIHQTDGLKEFIPDMCIPSGRKEKL
jgi:hypothetical protein